MEIISNIGATVLAFINPAMPYVSHYGVLPGLYLWSLFTIAPWFFMLARLKNMGYHTDRESVVRLYRELGLLTTLSVLPFAVLGVIADVIFNLGNGSIIFRELPREFLFTSRIERWEEEATKAIAAKRKVAGQSQRNGQHATDEEIKKLRRRERLGVIWARRLNAIMPGHV
jgi:hypothetical protein